MDVPDVLTRHVLEKRLVAAPTQSRSEESYGWVRLQLISTSELRPEERKALDNPDAPLFFVYRWDVPKHLADDENSPFTGRREHTHTESFRTQDVHAAFSKAAEYQPDWSKWDRWSAFDNCW